MMSLRLRSAGFTLLSTLFLLVVVSLLGAYMVKLATAQHLTSALEIDALRARYAAYSGLEWVQSEVINTSACPSVPSVLTVGAYQVSMTACNASNVVEGTVNYQLFDVTVLASRGSFGSAGYTQARLQATLRDW